MKLTIETFDAFPCSTRIFTINGIEANEYDFGEKHIYGSAIHNKCCCEFIPKMPTQNVLDMYNISLDEYQTICDELSSALYVFHCGWCG